MQTVYKYVLSSTTNNFEVPRKAIPLCVFSQYRRVCIWFRVCVGQENATEIRTFKLVGTGHAEIEETDIYIGTAHTYEGSLVLHVFEVKK